MISFAELNDPKLNDLTSFSLVKTLFSKIINENQLKIIDGKGGVHVVGDGKGKSKTPCASIQLHDPKANWKILINPNLYLGEAYMDGHLTIEEGDLRTFLETIAQNLVANKGLTSQWLRLLGVKDFIFRRAQQFNTLAKAQSNVSHHYDLPAEFYQLFLDQEQQYSCAYFTSDTMTLEEAQKQKMKHILAKLLIEPGQRVLDIGCGWGGLACYIAQETGAKVTGITLSKEQRSAAQAKAEKMGLSKQVQFQLCDYRRMEGSFDRIVSVGMFEHVGINHYRDFFENLQRLLGKQGVALLHSIGRVSGPRATNPWIQKYIFPGGHLPSLSEVIPHVEKSGLVLTDLEVLRLHYAKTLSHWSARFQDQRSHVENLYGERFCRMWEFYLAASEVSFKYFGNMVFQMQVAAHQTNVPLTRDYLYSSKAV